MTTKLMAKKRPVLIDPSPNMLSEYFSGFYIRTRGIGFALCGAVQPTHVTFKLRPFETQRIHRAMTGDRRPVIHSDSVGQIPLRQEHSRFRGAIILDSYRAR